MEALSSYVPVVLLLVDGPNSSSFFPSIENPIPNLWIVRRAFGVRRTRIGRRLKSLGRAIDAIILSRILKRLGFTDYIYWVASPTPGLLTGMRTTRLIYDCIDPCYIQSHQSAFDKAEAEMARRARLVFCTAESLLERMKTWNANSYLLPNGVDVKVFTKIVNDFGQWGNLARRLHQNKRPIVGYMGTIDYRIDVEALVFAAKGLPHCTFAIIGRVNPDQKDRVAMLRAIPNVIFMGEAKLSGDAVACTSIFDVGVIPFTSNANSDYINPVKMYTYLAVGIPVVTTWLKECRDKEPLVYATRSNEEFLSAIRRCIQRDVSATDENERIEFANKNTWAIRAKSAADKLLEAGVLT